MAEMPEAPAINRCHTGATPTPRGQAMPIPVTTTRRSRVIARIPLDRPPQAAFCFSM